MHSLPVAARMSWAADRETTRVEDRAYSLIGIFDVNLPLIYGEGEKAFLRLQETIARDNNDLSLFAWHDHVPVFQYRGILARDPSEFRNCQNIEAIYDLAIPSLVFAITNNGLEITTSLGRGDCNDYLFYLNCANRTIEQNEEQDGIVVIRLVRTSFGYARHQADRLCIVDPQAISLRDRSTLYISKAINSTQSLQILNALKSSFRVDVLSERVHCRLYHLPTHLWDTLNGRFLSDGHHNSTGIIRVSFKRPGSTVESECFIVCGLRRDADDRLRPWIELIVDTEGSPNTASELVLKTLESPYALSSLGRTLCTRLREEGHAEISDHQIQKVRAGYTRRDRYSRLKAIVRIVPEASLGWKIECKLDFS